VLLDLDGAVAKLFLQPRGLVHTLIRQGRIQVEGVPLDLFMCTTDDGGRDGHELCGRWAVHGRIKAWWPYVKLVLFRAEALQGTLQPPFAHKAPSEGPRGRHAKATKLATTVALLGVVGVYARANGVADNVDRDQVAGRRGGHG